MSVKTRFCSAGIRLSSGFEISCAADFEDCSYGFRPGRNAHQALERIAAALKAGKTEVYDADLEGYFDSIPHDNFMKCIRMRVVDGAVLGLIKQWLEAPVVEEI
jgi:RNA-directed DNA polymerase